MVLYRGVEIGSELASSIRYMDQVEEYREALQALQAVWDTLALLGHLSGTRIEIGEVRSAFSGLTTRLLNSLGSELRRKAVLDLQAKAQVAIDILVRNLFERTADIGFLATDSDLRAFAEALPETRERTRADLIARFQEYQRKYSVYANIILLSPQGEVLAQLDPSSTLVLSRDPLIEECRTTSAAYVETYRHSDLAPDDAKSLIYSYRVTSNDGQNLVGVLCLCFRFEDECRRIFDSLIKRTDWCVITLIDQQGRVIASSDVHQASLGARITSAASATTQVMRFGGRPFLSTVCKTSGYQGYLGPGWSGHAMLPLEFAFSADDEPSIAQELSDADRARIMASELLFSAALRDIPSSAGRIQAELNRAVWNGNVALARAGGGTNNTFSKTLLREIGHTGMRTRDVFSGAIGNMNQTVVSSTLRDCRAKAALAIDIMDRNLYERANDCRWWALTTAFRKALAAPVPPPDAPDEITHILETINGLYTVYTNLVVFDGQGCIVATSNPAYRERVGQKLDARWVRDTLALGTTESYCVSAFEPSDLYEDRHTYVYCAAIRAVGRTARVVGGIAIVFDAAPQFTAMLTESLPRDERGVVKPGAFGVFVDNEGQVIASSRAETPLGTKLQLTAASVRNTNESSWERVLPFEGQLYAVGACRSAGYREYKGDADPYRNDITSLVFVPLADGAAAHEAPPLPARTERRGPPLGDSADALDLASFAVGNKWYAVQASQVVEAVRPGRIATLPGAPSHIRGCVMVEGNVLLVVDLPSLLSSATSQDASLETQLIVIIRDAQSNTRFGLLVDELGDTFEVSRARLGSTQLAQTEHVLVESVVTPDAGAPVESLLLVLSIERLAACGRGISPDQLTAFGNAQAS
ncbi:MAG: chemotaxis protein CheW [Polyangiales bacterium]